MKFIIVHNQTDANRVANRMNQAIGCPVVGRYRGELNPDKQQTVRWATARERTDGKWCVRIFKNRIPLNIRTTLRNWLDANITYVVQDKEDWWFK